MTMTDAFPPPRAPKVVGPWQIMSRVGSGGMGVVYKATRGDRMAAVKVVRPGLLDDPAVQARFAREVEVLRRVRDLHISEFLDADLLAEPAWLATAFIEGPTLRDAIAARGPLHDDAWWQLARGLAQALAVLEVHGITHRDIKPANVILAEHGPVLIDFGIAIPDDAVSLTGTGLVAGSPAWLSPEQANMDPITVASDVFSLGSLLAFAGTGRPPFGSGASVAVLLAISSRDPDMEGLDEAQRRLVGAMVGKQPGNRPSARDVLHWSKNRAAGMPEPGAETALIDTGALSQTQVIGAQTSAGTAPVAVPAEIPAWAEPPPTNGGGRKRRSGLRTLLVILIVGLLAGLWAVNREGGVGTRLEERLQESPTPTPGPTPPAPAAGTLATSGDWVLTGWSIDNNASGQMSVTGTIKNTGTAPAAGFATVYIYANGVPIGSASGQLPEVPAGGQAEVTLPGTDQWSSGTKTVALVVQ